MQNNLKELQNILGWEFSNPDLLEEALTHSSSSTKESSDNERLEFLGDRIVGLAIADILFYKYPDDNEGGLAKRHAALVSGKTLSIVAKEMNIGRYLKFSLAEKNTGGAGNEHILANAMEAILGAMYIDGGLEPCHALINTQWEDKIDKMVEPPQDPKTELQEWAQARGLEIPQYKLSDKIGPDHSPTFVISLDIEGYGRVRAEGASKRKAEKKVAAIFLEKIKNND